jgi:hypothetical protein
MLCVLRYHRSWSLAHVSQLQEISSQWQSLWAKCLYWPGKIRKGGLRNINKVSKTPQLLRTTNSQRILSLKHNFAGINRTSSCKQATTAELSTQPSRTLAVQRSRTALAAVQSTGVYRLYFNGTNPGLPSFATFESV